MDGQADALKHTKDSLGLFWALTHSTLMETEVGKLSDACQPKPSSNLKPKVIKAFTAPRCRMRAGSRLIKLSEVSGTGGLEVIEDNSPGDYKEGPWGLMKINSSFIYLVHYA